MPLKTAVNDWARANRYAGAKDRAFISGLCLDVLRRRGSLGGPVRFAVMRALAVMWQTPMDALTEAAQDEHGPGMISEDDAGRLFSPMPGDDAQDFPDWVIPMAARVFDDDMPGELAALCSRADIDLRINALKTEPERALKAVKPVGGQAVPGVSGAARIAAPDPAQKAPPVTVIPAFNKGWVEVQDIGSQIAALAAGPFEGGQILDLCAGGGGKSLALAAHLGNRGQVHAFDIDARRLRPIYARLKRAGARNVQVVDPGPRGGDVYAPLSPLRERMDVVFVDAPCTGAGTWRRHPDTKWRLNEAQLARRIAEQDTVLRIAADYVRPGGRLVYVTCSFFQEENEDRVEAFLRDHPGFAQTPALDAIKATGAITPPMLERLEAAQTQDKNALRLTPARTGTDGFFISVLMRTKTAPMPSA